MTEQLIQNQLSDRETEICQPSPRIWGEIGMGLQSWRFRAFTLLHSVVLQFLQILRLDLLDIRFRRTLAHRLQHLFEWRRVALDPTERVDTRQVVRDG